MHKQWNEGELSQMIEGGFPFPMLCDPGGTLGRPYGIYDETAGVDLRGTVFINEEGIIQLISVGATPVGRDVGEIVRSTLAFNEHAECGNVIPAGWKPGEKTIEPKPENSGQIYRMML